MLMELLCGAEMDDSTAMLCASTGLKLIDSDHYIRISCWMAIKKAKQAVFTHAGRLLVETYGPFRRDLMRGCMRVAAGAFGA